MNVEDFIEKYYALNSINQHIVFHVLGQMNRSKKHVKVNTLIHQRILEKRTSLNIGYLELYRLLNQKLNNTVSKKTYEAFINRKSIESELLPVTCEILDIPIGQINRIKFDLLLITNDRMDVGWLYTALNKREQSAISYMTSALYMAEHHPEVFDSYDDY